MDNSRIADMSRLSRTVTGAMVSGITDAVAPVSVVGTSEGLMGVYDLTGLSDISRMKLNAWDVLDLTGRILDALDRLKDILIFPEDIVLNEKVIFTDDVTGNVRICVIPGKAATSEKENVAFMLGRLETVTDDKGSEYLEILKKEYLEKNYSHYGLLALTEDMKREAGY